MNEILKHIHLIINLHDLNLKLSIINIPNILLGNDKKLLECSEIQKLLINASDVLVIHLLYRNLIKYITEENAILCMKKSTEFNVRWIISDTLLQNRIDISVIMSHCPHKDIANEFYNIISTNIDNIMHDYMDDQ